MATLQNVSNRTVELSTGQLLQPAEVGNADPDNPREQSLIGAGVLAVYDPDGPIPPGTVNREFVEVLMTGVLPGDVIIRDAENEHWTTGPQTGGDGGGGDGIPFDGSVTNAKVASNAAIALTKLAVDPRARSTHTGTQTASTVSDFDTQVRTSRLDQLAAPTADVGLNGRKVTSVATPTAAQDAATKAYVDSIAQGLIVKASVRAATTANVTLSGAQTIDGVSVVAGDRVLVKNQTAPAQNGLYVAAAGAWSRAADMDAWSEVPSAFTFVEQGTTNASIGWVVTSEAGGTLGTTAIDWSQFTGAGTIVGGAGLTKTGNTLDVGAGTGLTVAPDTVGITPGGVTATELAAALKGGAAAGVEALRALGTTATTAAAGNDARLSDQRVPTDGSVTVAKFAQDMATQAELDTTNARVTAVETITGSTEGDTALGPYDAIDATWQTLTGNVKMVTRVQAAADGSIPYLDIYMDGNGGSAGPQAVTAVVYADDGTGTNPVARLAASTARSIAAGDAAAWLRFVFSIAPNVTSGQYVWIGWHAGTQGATARYTVGGGGLLRYNSDTLSDGAADPFGTPTALNQHLSIRGVVRENTAAQVALLQTAVADHETRIDTIEGATEDGGTGSGFTTSAIVNFPMGAGAVAETSLMPGGVLMVSAAGDQNVASASILDTLDGATLRTIAQAGSGSTAFANAHAVADPNRWVKAQVVNGGAAQGSDFEARMAVA